MHMKRLAALIMTVVLTLGMLSVPSSAASGDIQLTFSLTDVSGEVPTLELGLNVTTDGEERFKSVGAVLEFDNTVLELIPWNTYVAYPLSSATNWSTAVPVGTKGIDEYMSSASQAYTLDTKTYLYLSAEAITPQSLAEPDGTRVATVRFKYKDGKSAADVTAETVKLAADKDVIFASPVQHGAVYHNDADFYYYNPLTEGGNNSAITDAEITAEYILPTPTFEQVKAGESIVPGADGVNTDDILSVAFYDWDETLLGILAVPKGEDISQRVNDYVRLFIHPELDDRAEDGGNLNAEQVAAMMASNARTDTYRGKYPSTYGDDSTADLTGSSYPLTNKLDYVFYKGDTTAEDYDGCYFAHGWIPVTAATLDGRAENGVFTAYESPEAAAAAQPVDFSKGITESIMVKAAYVPGEELKNGETDFTEAYYTITDIAYNRYGTATSNSGSYSITATIERINSEGYGVTRLRYPSYYIAITPDMEILPEDEGKKDVAIRIDLDSRDETLGEVVAPKASSQTSIKFINVTVENWLGADVKAQRRDIPRDGDEGYVTLGTMKVLNNAVADLLEGRITNAQFNSIAEEITYKDIGIAGLSDLQGGTIARPNIARNKFKLAYAANCGNEIEAAFIRELLTTEIPTSVVNLGNDIGYADALGYIEDALQNNGNIPLTVEQTIYAILNQGNLN